MQELKPERCYMSFSFLVANTLFERDENRTNLFNPNSPTQFFLKIWKGHPTTWPSVAGCLGLTRCHLEPPHMAVAPIPLAFGWRGVPANAFGLRGPRGRSFRCAVGVKTHLAMSPNDQRSWIIDTWIRQKASAHFSNLRIFSYVAPTSGVRCWFSQAGMFVGVFRSWFLEAVFGQIVPTPTKSLQLISEFLQCLSLWSFLKTSLQMRWKVSRFRC